MKTEIDTYLKSIAMPPIPPEKNNLKYCTRCNTVFETWWGSSYGRQETKHFDMPTYGVTRKHCKGCAKQ